MNRILLIVLIFLINYAEAQPVFIKDSLEQYITRGMRQSQVPGMAIAIVKDGKIVHLKGYGVLNLQSKEAVNEHSVFMIGSNTKVFTATALTMLEQDKKLSLDDKVTKWVPYFRLRDPLASEAATVRDLLCHRIGFETFQGDFTYWASTLNRQEVIKKMAAVQAPYGFRTRWGYCNAAFATAGEVVGAVSGEPWETYIREHILKPLKMNNTYMLAAELSNVKNMATPYTRVDGKLTSVAVAAIDNLAPAGTISSSAHDMVNWVMAQLDAGKFDNKQVISEAAIAETRIPQSIQGFDPADKRNTHFYLYGLGMGINDRAGKVIVSHTGGVDGFLSSVMLIPEEKLGIVILTNTDENSLFQDLTREIRDAYLNLPYVGYIDRTLKGRKLQQQEEKKVLDSLNNLVAKKNKPALPLNAFTGVYTNELYGEVTIKEMNNKLSIHFQHHPNLKGSLDYLTDNTFLCTYSIPTYGMKPFSFHMEGGKVKGFTLRVADFVEFTPYEFSKK